MSRTVIITGASGSMGAVAVRAEAMKGSTVIMAVRNLQKAAGVRESIAKDIPDADIRIMELRLDSLSSVRDFVAAVLAEGIAVDALFNNAGVISRSFRLTENGLENTLQTNFLSPALLTLQLLPAFSEKARIVNMVSLTCRFASIDKDLFTDRNFSQLGTYSKTKLALLLFSIALYRHLGELGKPGLHVNVADPGIVNSNMISMGRWFDPLADVLFRPFCSSPEKGAAPALRAMETEKNLRYFVGKGDREIASRYLSHPLADWLWNELSSWLRELPSLPQPPAA